MKDMKSIIYSIYSEGCKELTDNYYWIRDRQKQYADLCEADYKVFNFKFKDYTALQFEKLFLLDRLSKDYDNILYLDFDVIPSLTADNIFKKNFSLAMLPLIRSEGNCFKSAIKNKTHRRYNTIHKSEDIIFNTGVIYATSYMIEQLDLISNFNPFVKATNELNNESYMTWIVEAYGIEYQPLSLSWNYLLDNNDINIPVDTNFIHYSNKRFILP